MAKVTNILAGDGYRGDLSDIISTTTAEEKKKLREQFFKDLADNAVSLPVGFVEGAVGLPGDIEGLARGAYRAYNAEDGDRLEAFGSAFADTAIPSTQQIQEWTDENLFDNELGEMIKRGKYGRFGGELLSPATLVTAPGRAVAKAGAKLANSGAKAYGKLALEGADQLFNKMQDMTGIDLQPSIFIGPKAKTYPHEVAKKVEKLEKQGKSPKEIWNTIYKEHGELPYRTKDDVLWFERDDSLLKTSPVEASKNKAYRLDEIVQSKDNPYFDEYPVMKVDTASVKPNRTQGKSSYSPRTGYDELGDKPRYEFGVINDYGGPDPMSVYREIKEASDAFNKSPKGIAYNKEVDELSTVLREINRDSKKLKKSSNYEADRLALNKRIDKHNQNIAKLYDKYPEVIDYKEKMGFWMNRINPKTLNRIRKNEAQVSLENFRHEGQHGIQHIEGAGHGGSGRDPEYPYLLGEQMSNANAGRGNLTMAERANRFIGEPDGTAQTFTKPDVDHIVRRRTPRFDEKELPDHLKQLFKDKFGKEDSFFENIRLAEDDMMKYANDIEFTHNNKAYTKGGPVSQLPGGGHYEMPTYAQRHSDDLFGKSFVNPNERQGYVHSRLNNAERHGSFAPRHDVQKIKEGQDVSDMLWYSDTHYRPNRPGYTPEGTFVSKKSPGTYFHKPSYVTDGLTENKIRNMQNVEPRNLTVDEAFTRGTANNSGRSTVGDFYQELYNTKAGNYPESIRRNYMFDQVNKLESPYNSFNQIEDAGYFPREAGRGKLDVSYDLKATPEQLKEAYPKGRLPDDFNWSSFDDEGTWLGTTKGQKDFKPSGSRIGDVEPVTLDQNALKRMSAPVRKKLESSIEQINNILNRNANRKPGYLEEDLTQLTRVLDDLNVEKSTKSVEDVKRYAEQAYKKLLLESDSRSINMIRPEKFNDDYMTSQGLLDANGELTVTDDIAGDADDLEDLLRRLYDDRAGDNYIE